MDLNFENAPGDTNAFSKFNTKKEGNKLKCVSSPELLI